MLIEARQFEIDLVRRSDAMTTIENSENSRKQSFFIATLLKMLSYTVSIYISPM